MQEIKSDSSPIRILLGDTHEIVRQGIHQAIDNQPDMLVVGESDNGHELLDLAQQHQPDVIILDIKLSGLNGVKVTQCLHNMLRPEVTPKVLVFTADSDKQYIWSLLSAGATGYLLKSEPMDQLVVGLRQMAAGHTILSQSIQTNMVTLIPYLNQTLSDSEGRVVQLLARGFSNEEIAQQLSISEGTVKSHLSNTYRKIPWVRTRAEAISWAWINHLVPEGKYQ